MDKRLQRQLEQLLDEDGSRALEVLVQMAPDDEQVSELLKQSSRAIETRNSIISARELTPPPFKVLKAASPRSAGSWAFSRSGTRTMAQAGARGSALLKPLTNWAAGTPALRGAREPVLFRASGSALMTMHRDVLARLPSEVPNVSAVYRNRRVSMPPVAKARSLPAVVADNKAHVWGVSRTGAMACWGAFNARGQGVRVAVLDTGADGSHPDLAGRIADFAEFDANGRIVKSGIEACHDSDSHGTHVAGSIVGGRGSGRWIGMAPEAKLLVGLVLKRGSGTDAQILAGMQWALESGADVINLSLGGLRMSPEVLDTYTQMIISANLQGVPVVVAVGNEGAQTSSSPGNDYFAFTVGATDVDDRAAGFSGGRTQIIETSRYIDEVNLPLVYSKPEVTAPGVDVYSSVPKGKWEAYSGSSMATPHVAGAIAVLLSGLNQLNKLPGSQRVAAVQQLLASSVKELGEAGQNHRYGYGRIDVLRACGFGIELGY
jgi:subtilisin family serine protease